MWVYKTGPDEEHIAKVMNSDVKWNRPRCRGRPRLG